MDFDTLDPQSTPSYDDEIDLFQLFETIWDGKWLIAAITALSVVFAGVGVLLTPTLHKGTVQIVSQSPGYIADFAGLAPLLGSENIVTGEDDNIKIVHGQVSPVITAESLRADFLREFNDYNEVRAVIETHTDLLSEFEGTEQEREEFLASIARKFFIVDDQLSFEEIEEVTARKVMTVAFPLIYANVGQQNFVRLQKLAAAISDQTQADLERVEREIQATTEVYEFNLLARTAFLAEQAAIARELGLSDGVTELFVNTTRNPQAIRANAEVPFYLRGYKAIEKELAVLRARPPSHAHLYSPGLSELIRRRSILETDSRASQLDRLIQTLPLTQPDFEPVIVDLDLMEVESTKKSMLVLALSIVLGGMVSVLFVLIRSGYRNHKARTAALD